MGAPDAAPRRSPMRRSNTLRHLFDLEPKPNPPINGFPLPLPLPPQSDADEFLSIISDCTRSFTFTDPSESSAERDLKRRKISQLLLAARCSKLPLDDPRVLPSLVSMLAANLFRDLPLPSTSSSCAIPDSVEDEMPPMVLVPSWMHIRLAYDLLSVIVSTIDAAVLRLHVDQAFLARLLCLFHSEDPRERDQVKNVYHQIYSKLTFHRRFMRRSMHVVFLRVAFEAEEGRQHCGVGEMLEIWGSIINGMAVPLKKEHKVFLARVLIPLHRPKCMHAYHRELCYCVSQFVRKDPVLGSVVVRGLTRYWPATDSQKEVLLIGELEELAESAEEDVERLAEWAAPLCSRITRCMSSCNSQVAERALYVWTNEQFVKMASLSFEQVLPAVVQTLEKNIGEHWSKPVRQLSLSVKKMLEEMDPERYSTCLQELKRRELMKSEEEARRKERWDKVEMMASERKAFQQHRLMSVILRQG